MSHRERKRGASGRSHRRDTWAGLSLGSETRSVGSELQSGTEGVPGGCVPSPHILPLVFTGTSSDSGAGVALDHGLALRRNS